MHLGMIIVGNHQMVSSSAYALTEEEEERVNHLLDDDPELLEEYDESVESEVFPPCALQKLPSNLLFEKWFESLSLLLLLLFSSFFPCDF